MWEKVSSMLLCAKVRPVSEDFSALPARADRDDGGLADRFPRRPGSVGIVGFIGGRVTGCDIIPDPGTFAHYFDRLVRSYALDGEYLKEGPAEVCGSALVHGDSVVHLAAFAPEARRPDAASFRRGFEI